jgi:hypothetical protein
VRRVWLILLAFAAGTVPSAHADAQDNRTRFEITSPTDTTFTIILGDVRWVKVGMTGDVVDPALRDRLVGRFSVNSIVNRTARARITGLTTSIRTNHFALLRQPKVSWLKDKFLWIGAGVGLAVGFFIGKS